MPVLYGLCIWIFFVKESQYVDSLSTVCIQWHILVTMVVKLLITLLILFAFKPQSLFCWHHRSQSAYIIKCDSSDFLCAVYCDQWGKWSRENRECSSAGAAANGSREGESWNPTSTTLDRLVDILITQFEDLVMSSLVLQLVPVMIWRLTKKEMSFLLTFFVFIWADYRKW